MNYILHIEYYLMGVIMKKIIVIGAGHGGLITASLLSKYGFDVTIYEKRLEKDLGYDWQDTFNISPFVKLGIPILKYKYKKQNKGMTLYSPSKKYKIKTNTKEKSIRMNRKELYKCLIQYAKENKVKFVFNSRVDSLIIKNNEVIGVNINNKEILSDLVIDSSGIDNNLNDSINDIEKIDSNDIFYMYRQIQNTQKLKSSYDVFLKANRGISWIIDDNKDILIGSIKSLENEYINNELKKLNIKRENIEIYKVPIRRPLSQFVYSGYVLIGDSASMTVPLTGSGLSICALSSKILSDVIIRNQNKKFSIDVLWDYQVEYFLSIGHSLAVLDAFKILLLKLNEKDIEYIFKNINGYDKSSILKRIIIYIKNLGNIKLLKRLVYVLEIKGEIKKICRQIPKQYDEKLVNKWKNEYNLIFKKI